MEYWHFGTTTENALGTYQASNGLPDTGLTCIHTWKSLLGEDTFALGPKEALKTVGDGRLLIHPLTTELPRRLNLHMFQASHNKVSDRAEHACTPVKP